MSLVDRLRYLMSDCVLAAGLSTFYTANVVFPAGDGFSIGVVWFVASRGCDRPASIVYVSWKICAVRVTFTNM